VLVRVVDFVAARGHDEEELCRSVGLSAAALRDPEVRVPYAVAERLGERAARLTGDANLGLHLAQDVRDTSRFDAAMLLLMASPSIRAALERMVRHQRHWGDGERCRIAPARGGLSVRYALASAGAGYQRQADECAMAELAIGVRFLSGRDLSPRVVRFRHVAPHDTREHRALFRCPIEFGAPYTEMVLDDAVLDTAMQHANEAYVGSPEVPFPPLNPAAAGVTTWIVFALVYVGLALGKLPLVHLDRAGIALVGATAMLVLGLVGFDAAVGSVDFATIALLFGMMVVVAYLRLGGFLRGVAGWLFARARSPLGVLAAVVALAGLLSAFLVNDVVCLALGPVVLTLARRTRRHPAPYLVALATAANIGSTATITGNPQNMIIGALSHISYASFAARLAPPALAGLLIDYAVVAFAFRRALARPVDESHGPPPRDPAGEPRRELLPKGIAVLVGLVVLFFAGAPIALVALGAAALLLVGRVRPQELYAQIDWNLLVMFAGLFVVVHGFEQHVVSAWDLQRFAVARTTTALALAAAALSNLVSNVPAVLVMRSFVASIAPEQRAHAWLTLAMASTLSGNLTPVASVANLIVVEGARREGVHVSFWDYCRVGVPVTVLTLAAGVAWLAVTQ
jgi:Na+/H+ antiporter NhaD/arsenite permease-like protein